MDKIMCLTSSATSNQRLN